MERGGAQAVLPLGEGPGSTDGTPLPPARAGWVRSAAPLGTPAPTESEGAAAVAEGSGLPGGRGAASSSSTQAATQPSMPAVPPPPPAWSPAESPSAGAGVVLPGVASPMAGLSEKSPANGGAAEGGPPVDRADHRIDILPSVAEVDRLVDEWRPVSHADPDPTGPGEPGAPQQVPPSQALLVAKEEYIPLRVAREKMREMCAEVARAKAQHLEALDRAEAQHRQMKASAEEKVKAFVAALAERHGEEMQKQRKAYQQKMKRMRAEILGSVDEEVDLARQRLKQLEAEQAERREVADMKVHHEHALLEERRAGLHAEVEKLAASATEKQRRAEEELEAERVRHAAECTDMRMQHDRDLERSKKDIQNEAEQGLQRCVEEHDKALKAKLHEHELAVAASSAELQSERQAMAEQRASEEALRARFAGEGERLGGQLSTALCRARGLNRRNQHRLREVMMMTAIDLEAQSQQRCGVLRDEAQQLQGQLAQVSAELQQRDEAAAEREGRLLQCAADIDGGKSEILQLQERVAELEEQKETASQAQALADGRVSELEGIQKELHELRHSNSTSEAVAVLLRSRNSNTEQLQASGWGCWRSGWQAGIDASVVEARVAVLLLGGDTQGMQTLHGELSEKHRQGAEQAALQHAELQAAMQGFAAPQQEEGGSGVQAQLLASLAEGGALPPDTLSQFEAAHLQAKQGWAAQGDVLQRVSEAAVEVQANSNAYADGAARAAADLEAALASNAESSAASDALVAELEGRCAELEGTEGLHGKGDDMAQLRQELEEKESALQTARTASKAARSEALQLRLASEQRLAEQAHSFSERHAELTQQLGTLLGTHSTTLPAQHGAALQQSELARHACLPGQDDTPEMLAARQQLLETTAALDQATADALRTAVSQAETYNSLYTLCGTMQVLHALGSTVRRLDSALAGHLVGPATQQQQGAADPEVEQRLAKALADKKGLAAQLQQAKQAREKEVKKEVRRLEKAAGNAAQLSKDAEALRKENKEGQQRLAEEKKKAEKLLAEAGDIQEVRAESADLKASNKELKRFADEKEEAWKKEALLRKKYFNEIQDLKGKIRVMVRCRPMNSIEKKKGSLSVAEFPDDTTIAIPTKKKEFAFDHVFSPDSHQDGVWNEAKHFVQSAIDGYNTCIFAYGQTGSGKTFTMEGSPEKPGITPRCINEVFETLENMKNFTYNVTCYMLELYLDNLNDLLLDKAKVKGDIPALDIKKDAKGVVQVVGATTIAVKTREDLAMEYVRGCKQRRVRNTGMNAASSRSHLVFGILIETTHRATGKVVLGKMSLVDLAGSERMDKTGITDEAGQKEAKAINKSLTALGDVISALSTDPSGFIPYRNNKLTMLMCDSLGGNAKTMMIAAVSPASYNADETTNTLSYAARTKNITNDASKATESKEVARLKAVIAKLKAGEQVEVE